MDSVQFQRTMSLTDVNTSSAIRDGIERDITIPGDKNRHRFFLQLPKHDFILPSLTRFDQDFRKFLLAVLVDFDLMHSMQDAKCINWCTKLPKFLPLQTLGDGNCLMHAASLCMWAVQDRRLTLRKSVYQVLIEDQTGRFSISQKVEVNTFCSTYLAMQLNINRYDSHALQLYSCCSGICVFQCPILSTASKDSTRKRWFQTTKLKFLFQIFGLFMFLRTKKLSK